MKINSLNFGFASAITAAVFWLVCSLLIWAMPGTMMDTTGSLIHMDMSKFGWMMSPSGVIMGMIVWSLFAGIFAGILAAIYNLLTKN